jgi:hypothetical protein
MSHKTERARRRVMSKLYADIMNKKANSDATLTLRREIFRIVSVLVIIVLLVLLYRHW